MNLYFPEESQLLKEQKRQKLQDASTKSVENHRVSTQVSTPNKTSSKNSFIMFKRSISKFSELNELTDPLDLLNKFCEIYDTIGDEFHQYQNSSKMHS